MGGMGPPPKDADQRARRNATVSMTLLPAKGRSGKPPAWPLIPDVVLTAKRNLAADKVEVLRFQMRELEEDRKSTSAVERRLDGALERLAILEAQLSAQKALEVELWADLWKLPQAVQWDHLKWTRDVAQYARFKVMAELGDLDSAKEARQWSDRLGLTPLSMLRLRWKIADAAVAKPAVATEVSGAKARYGNLQVVRDSA